MKYYFLMLIAIMIVAMGCSSEVAKDTTKDTAKDVVKEVDQGITNLAQNVGEAAPDIKEDIKEGFWSAFDTVAEAFGVDTGKPLPVPGEAEIKKLHAKVDAAEAKTVVKSAKKVKMGQIVEVAQAMSILGQTIQEEMNRAEGPQTTVDGAVSSTTPSATGPKAGTSSTITAEKAPTPEEVKAAWEAISKLTDKPSAIRKIFEVVQDYVNKHPELKAQAGIAGPVTMDKVGKKGQEFLAKMQVGDISKPIRFMKGFAIVQLINNAPDMVEVGYIYIKSEEKSETLPGTTTPPAGGQAVPGSSGDGK